LTSATVPDREDQVAELPLADRHETVLPPPRDAADHALVRALDAEPSERPAAVGAVVAAHPTDLSGWAHLAALTDVPIERYAYARVGYHRGLDALRAAGWGGRGFVRWSQPTNRPFLRCLALLRDAAATIGETAEVERIDAFLHELDPDWDDAVLAG
jgi:hypothetical protein